MAFDDCHDGGDGSGDGGGGTCLSKIETNAFIALGMTTTDKMNVVLEDIKKQGDTCAGCAFFVALMGLMEAGHTRQKLPISYVLEMVSKKGLETFVLANIQAILESAVAVVIEEIKKDDPK